jgi:hypothetical protein
MLLVLSGCAGLQDMVLRWLPVTHNKAVDAEAVDAEAAAAALGDSPIKSVLRSKGFMWLSNKHTTAFYRSHAGEASALKMLASQCAACLNRIGGVGRTTGCPSTTSSAWVGSSAAVHMGS